MLASGQVGASLDEQIVQTEEMTMFAKIRGRKKSETEPAKLSIFSDMRGHRSLNWFQSWTDMSRSQTWSTPIQEQPGLNVQKKLKPSELLHILVVRSLCRYHEKVIEMRKFEGFKKKIEFSQSFLNHEKRE